VSRTATIWLYYSVLALSLIGWVAGLVIDNSWVEFGGLAAFACNSFMPDFSSGKPLAWRRFGWIWFYTLFVFANSETDAN